MGNKVTANLSIEESVKIRGHEEAKRLGLHRGFSQLVEIALTEFFEREARGGGCYQ